MIHVIAKYLLILIMVTLGSYVTAQVNTDSLFASAVNDSRQALYNEAISKAKQILLIHPNRSDVMIFAANIHAWQSEYNDALNYIDKAYKLNKESTDLYDSWLNILLWSDNFNKIIEVSEIAKQNNYSNNYNIIYKSALAYKNLGEYNNGINLIDENTSYLDSAKLKYLYIELHNLNKSGAVSLYYSIDIFDNSTFKPQHIAFIDYALKIKKHTLIPRFNYANRFNTNDFLAEVDYYHMFKKKQYLYNNLGVSVNQSLFPNFAAAIEYYFPLMKSSEASLGSRYLRFGDNDVVTLTGNINTYYKNLWFMFRPYFVIQDTKNTFSTILNARLYSTQPFNYWGLELLYGTSPDEWYRLSQSSQVFLLNNYRIKIEKNTAVFKYHELKLSGAYSYEENFTNTYRNRFTFELLLKIKI